MSAAGRFLLLKEWVLWWRVRLLWERLWPILQCGWSMQLISSTNSLRYPIINHNKHPNPVLTGPHLCYMDARIIERAFVEPQENRNIWLQKAFILLQQPRPVCTQMSFGYMTWSFSIFSGLHACAWVLLLVKALPELPRNKEHMTDEFMAQRATENILRIPIDSLCYFVLHAGTTSPSPPISPLTPPSPLRSPTPSPQATLLSSPPSPVVSPSISAQPPSTLSGCGGENNPCGCTSGIDCGWGLLK